MNEEKGMGNRGVFQNPQQRDQIKNALSLNNSKQTSAEPQNMSHLSNHGGAPDQNGFRGGNESHSVSMN